jgi:hypothetical protein
MFVQWSQLLLEEIVPARATSGSSEGSINTRKEHFGRAELKAMSPRDCPQQEDATEDMHWAAFPWY